LIFQYYAVHLVQGLGDIRWFNVLRISSTGLYSAGVVVGSILGLTVLRCAWIYVASQLLVTGIAAVDLLRRRKVRVTSADQVRVAVVPSARAIARFAVAGFLAQISPIESFRLDTLVVAAIFPSRIVGYYSVANSVTNVPLFAADALSAVGYPQVAAENGAQAVASTKRYMRIAVLLCGGTAVISMILLPIVTPLLFGSAYRPAVGTAELLVWAAVVLGLRRIGNDFLRALGKPALSTRFEAITLFAFAASLLFLAPVWSGRGVAIALIASGLLGLGLSLRILQGRRLARA
jgi:O-antigen/teichoic acid export membrane protein